MVAKSGRLGKPAAAAVHRGGAKALRTAHFAPIMPATARRMSSTWLSVSTRLPAGVDDEMGAPPLLAVGHLAGEHRVHARFAHARPRAEALALDRFRGAGNDDEVGSGLAADFEKERDVEDDGAAAGVSSRGAERLFPGEHQRVDERLEPTNRLGIADHPFTEAIAIDRTARGRAGKGGLDEARSLGAIEGVDRAVGIEDGDASRGEHCGHGRLSHRRRAGEAEDQHQSRAHGRKHRRAQRRRHRGPPAEPAFEAGHGLVQEHAESVDRAKAARACRREERRDERHIDDIGDDEILIIRQIIQRKRRAARPCRALSC